MSTSEVEVANWLNSLIHDKNYFTSRYISKYSEIFKVDPEMLAKGSVLAYIALLMMVKEPHYLANGLLVAIPIIVTFVFPAEKPPNSHLLIYWCLFGFSVIFDRILDFFPAFYVLKLACFLALYLPPSNKIIDKIDGFIKNFAK